MKIKCPHCSFDFDTEESKNIPFKIGQRVKILKSKDSVKHLFYQTRKSFDWKGIIVGVSLIHTNKSSRAKEGMWRGNMWILTIKYLPYSRKNGCSTIKLTEDQIRVIK